MGKRIFEEHIAVLDDLGMSTERDERAIHLVQQGNIDRVSIVVNLADCSYIKKELEKYQIKKDIHLNVTQVVKKNPVVEPTIIQNLYDRIRFFLSLYFVRNYPEGIVQQWESQIEQFNVIFGAYPDGINSHEHIHLIPRLFPHAVALSKKYGIKYLRVGGEPTSITKDYRARLLNLWHKKNVKRLQENSIETSVMLYSINWGNFSRSEIQFLIPKGSELVFHPQYEKDVALLEEL